MFDHSSMMFPETAHFSGRVVHYETDEALKRSKCRQAKITTKAALKRLQGDYFHYQICYKDHFTTDYSYFFESLIDTLKSYLDYCNLVLN